MSANRKVEATNVSAASRSPGLRKPTERLAPLARYGVGAPPKGPNDAAANRMGKKTFTVVKAPENKPTVRQRMDQAAAKTVTLVKKDDASTGVQIDKLREDILLLESGLSGKTTELEQLNSAKQTMILAKEKYQKEEDEIQTKIKNLDKKNKESVELTVARRTENAQLMNKETTLKGKLEELSRFEE